MLSSHARLKARESAKNGALPRQGYLAQLVAECASPETAPANKLQCLAHLANFAYDPINFGHLLRLNVVDLFVDVLDEALQAAAPADADSAAFMRLAMQGICNVAGDPRFQRLLFENDVLPLLLQATTQSDRATCAAAVATLFFLLDAPASVGSILTNPGTIPHVEACTASADVVVRQTAEAFMSRRQELGSGGGLSQQPHTVVTEE
ncbi:armadillo repeat containing 7 isoform 1 family protein [Achlya hypogyna]|uniref:Armadillo repeat containing 7 isoform 1 family protein n=1 Tax=Achlya hypogyna TaxID=1202772 RepID=A0A1V9ZM43_ACHHY|nr:armadillo repeat containing 7 isoform 1 family protein [Achlya hypogyna]